MTKIRGSGSISQKHGSANPDPDPDSHQCHGSATLNRPLDSKLCIFFGGLECVAHSFAYVAHFVFLREMSGFEPRELP
jgi:hypothetical protein